MKVKKKVIEGGMKGPSDVSVGDFSEQGKRQNWETRDFLVLQ